MLKKLQSILFEDEEIDVSDTIEEQPKEVVKKKEPTVVASTEVVEKVEEKPAMSTRIDVTQQIETPVQKEKAEPVFKPVEPVEHAEPPVAPIVTEPVKEQPKTLGLTVDDLTDKPAVSAKPAKPAKPTANAKSQRKQQFVYEFQPVISPIFGVDEKDLDALQTSGKTGRPGASRDENVSNIISPMYGMKPVKQEAPKATNTSYTKEEEIENVQIEEDDVPEFSLDDILKVRDDEFSESMSEQTMTEQTSLFGDEPNEDDVDQTRVFDASDITKK